MRRCFEHPHSRLPVVVQSCGIQLYIYTNPQKRVADLYTPIDRPRAGSMSFLCHSVCVFCLRKLSGKTFPSTVDSDAFFDSRSILFKLGVYCLSICFGEAGFVHRMSTRWPTSAIKEPILTAFKFNSIFYFNVCSDFYSISYNVMLLCIRDSWVTLSSVNRSYRILLYVACWAL